MVARGQRVPAPRHQRGPGARLRPPRRLPAPPASAATLDFIREPTARTWYRAHNISIASAYLSHEELAHDEGRVERFFINLVLARVLYAHALVSAPRLALGWLAPLGRFLGDPRIGVTGIFLSLSRVLPDRYPLEGDLSSYVTAEHGLGHLLDVGSGARTGLLAGLTPAVYAVGNPGRLRCRRSRRNSLAASDRPGRHARVADDPAPHLRPATPEEWPEFLRTMDGAFGETPRAPTPTLPRRSPRWTGRSGLWDGDRVVATAGIYSRELTVPGAVVPCAGITWVTVAPTHRRRGVLTSIMRRQLTECTSRAGSPWRRCGRRSHRSTGGSDTPRPPSAAA